MKKILALLLAIIMIFSLVACANSSEKETESEDAKTPDNSNENSENENSDEPIKIAYVTKEGDAYVMSVMEGVKDFCAEKGIDLTVMSYPDQDAETYEIKNLEDAEALGSDAIITNTVKPALLIDKATELVEKGITMVSVDADMGLDNQLCYVGISEYDQCYNVGKVMAERAPGGNFLIVVPTEANNQVTLRTTGYQDGIVAGGGVILDTRYGADGADKNSALIEDAITKYGKENIDGVCIWSGSWSPSAQTVLEQAGCKPGDIMLGAVGGFKVEYDLFEEGWQTATTCVNPYLMGYTAAECAYEHVVNGTEYDPQVNTELRTVTIDDYKEGDMADWNWLG